MNKVRNHQISKSILWLSKTKWDSKTVLDDKSVPVDGSSRESSKCYP